MNLKEKYQELLDLYARFKDEAGPYVASAVCRSGCADCCTSVGNVDVTTLEGLIILKHLQDMPDSHKKELDKKLKDNRKLKNESKYARCAFLKADDTCSIYAVRPFSCRRLYSLKTCGVTGPTVHRHVWILAGEIEAAIQLLDNNGYAGHMSYVLLLLKDAKFRNTYLNDGFAPDQIHDFLRTYHLSINRHASPPEANPSSKTPIPAP
jgi:hypothetical protein